MVPLVPSFHDGMYCFRFILRNRTARTPMAVLDRDLFPWDCVGSSCLDRPHPITVYHDISLLILFPSSGSTPRVYDIEHTLCDMAKTSHKADIQAVNEAMRMYAGSRDKKDTAHLMDYAHTASGDAEDPGLHGDAFMIPGSCRPPTIRITSDQSFKHPMGTTSTPSSRR